MKRQGYRWAVAWIAAEDDPEQCDVDAVAGTLTVALVADMFGKRAWDVASDVVHARKENER